MKIMRARSSFASSLLERFSVVVASIGLACSLGQLAADEPAHKNKPTAEELPLGREIFLREWVANDPRSHGGDGLGPVFNDTSCVACHNLGGAGGGGSASKNVDIITAAPANLVVAGDPVQGVATQDVPVRDDAAELLATAMRLVNGVRLLVGAPMIPVNPPSKSEQRINVDELAKLHPGFRTTRSIVLPRFGTEPEFEKWHPVRSVVGGELFSSAVPPPPQEAIEQTDVHPLFKMAFDAVLRRLGVTVESESVPQPKPRLIVSRTVTMGRVNDIVRIDTPIKVAGRDDGLTGPGKIVQAAAQATQEMVDFVAMLFGVDADLDTEPGLSREALIARSVRGMGSRPDVLSMTFDDNSSAFGAAVKNANALLVPAQRNPTALFGAGLIDRVPDSVIEDAAKVKYRDFPAVTGRVSRMRDGRIGKFGWKGQTASLRDFTLTACAVELGLNVPGHEQAVVPYKPEYRSPGLDLTEKECDALVTFIAGLPAPSRSRPANASYAGYLDAGDKLFAETGCAACHTRKLGDVDGIYSDLLLHDLGPALADSGVYGTILPEDPDENEIEPPIELVAVNAATNGQPLQATGQQPPKPRSRSPRRSEWRTPPLWGVRDSAPYLHDGTAESIQDAIAMHGGEALASTNKYFKLSHEERQRLIGFLKSLTAP
jgi:CxxC motif-containing protein (DUF1111 family)